MAKKIYQDTHLEVTEVVEPDAVAVISEEPSIKKVSTSDYAKSVMSYAPDGLRPFPVSSKTKGSCLICATQTAIEERKICPNCLKERGPELYEKYINSEKIGSDSFEIIS